jgi:ankyrin repeat protein
LIETHGADVNAQVECYNTPLSRAIEYFKPRNGGDINVLTYLIDQKNIDLNIKDIGDNTLLHTACINNFSNLRDSVELKAENDTFRSQIVEMIAEKYVQLVLGEGTF